MSAADAFDPGIQVSAVNLDQVKDTEIDLRRSGMALGDSIEVKVSLLRGADSTTSEKVGDLRRRDGPDRVAPALFR